MSQKIISLIVLLYGFMLQCQPKRIHQAETPKVDQGYSRQEFINNQENLFSKRHDRAYQEAQSVKQNLLAFKNNFNNLLAQLQRRPLLYNDLIFLQNNMDMIFQKPLVKVISKVSQHKPFTNPSNAVPLNTITKELKKIALDVINDMETLAAQHPEWKTLIFEQEKGKTAADLFKDMITRFERRTHKIIRISDHWNSIQKK